MVKLNTNQIGAIALVAIFILSTFAMYVGVYAQPKVNDTIKSTDILTGRATANATLVSYSPVLQVENFTQQTSGLIKQLKNDKIITQQIKTSDAILLTLQNSNDAPSVMRILEPSGATIYAQATIKTGPLDFVSGTTRLTINSTNYVSKMQPIFEPNESFTISMQASVYDGELYSYSFPSIETGNTFNAWVATKDVKTLSHNLQVVIPWENRNIDLSPFKSSLNTSESINYSQRSFILFSSAVDQQTLQQLSLSKPFYVTSLQPTSFSIESNFNNTSRIIEDLSVLNISVQFPPSILTFNSQNQSELAQLFLSEYNWTNATVSDAFVLELNLSDTFEYNGVNYTLPQNQVVTIDSQFEPNEDYGLIISASAISRRVVSFSPLSYMPNIYAQPEQAPIDDTILNNTIVDNDENNSMQSTIDSEYIEQLINNNTISTSYDDENNSMQSTIDSEQLDFDSSNQTQVEQNTVQSDSDSNSSTNDQ